MRIAIAGAGKVGRYMAKDLMRLGHSVILIDRNKDVIQAHEHRIPATWVLADATEPLNLRGAELGTCDVMVAATGDDKVNLVSSLLAKQEFGIRRVVGRVNHPNNEWLFDKSWGVDESVSPPHLLTALVEEVVVVGDVVPLLRFEQGKVLLVEVTLAEDSPAAGKVLGDLTLSRDSVITAVVRDGHVVQPRNETPLMVGDKVLALTSVDSQAEIKSMFSAAPDDGEESGDEDAPAPAPAEGEAAASSD